MTKSTTVDLKVMEWDCFWDLAAWYELVNTAHRESFLQTEPESLQICSNVQHSQAFSQVNEHLHCCATHYSHCEIQQNWVLPRPSQCLNYKRHCLWDWLVKCQVFFHVFCEISLSGKMMRNALWILNLINGNVEFSLCCRCMSGGLQNQAGSEKWKRGTAVPPCEISVWKSSSSHQLQ